MIPRKPDPRKELESLNEQLNKAWDENNINAFINTTHRMNLLFTLKIQNILDEKNITYTFDLKSKEAEENLGRINKILDETLEKKNELVTQLEAISHLENKLRVKKDENIDSSGK